MPGHLSEPSRALWMTLARDFGLAGDDHALLLLTAAMEARDRMVRARGRLDAEGETVADRVGGIKPHPLLRVEHDAHQRMLSSLRALRLDIEPMRAGPGRPPGI